MKKYLLVLFFIFLLGCATNKYAYQKNINRDFVDSNNVVIQKSNIKKDNTQSNDKIIFEGNNNLIEINREMDVSKVENSNKVLIIKGSNNNIALSSKNETYNEKNSKDTIIIKAENEKISLKNNKKHYKSTNSNEKSIYDIPQSDNIYTQNELEITKNEVLDNQFISVFNADSTLSVRNAITYYESEAKKGNIEANYHLCLLYQTKLQSYISSKKITDCYENAARNGNVDSQIFMARVYENGYYNEKIDVGKAIYYYSLAAQNGDEASKEKLKELK